MHFLNDCCGLEKEAADTRSFLIHGVVSFHTFLYIFQNLKKQSAMMYTSLRLL